MDLNGVPQPQMNWDSTNLVDTWKKFKQHVGLILDGPLAEKDEKVKITYLLLWVGEKGRDIYNTWQLSEDDAKKLSVHFDKFLTYVQPKQNSLLARCKFRYETQSSDTVEQFITRLKLIAKDCNFKDTDEMIRDSLIFGTSSPKVKEKLLNEGDTLTLEKAIQIAQAFEYSQGQLKEMKNLEPSTVVHELNLPRHSQYNSASSRKNHKTSDRTRTGPVNQNRVKVEPHRYSSQQGCGNCGRRHSKHEECPAKGKKCNSCQKWNHFAQVCRSKQRVDEVVLDTDSDSDQEFFIDCINEHNTFINDKNKVKRDQAFATITVCSKPIKFKLDTGSQVNILPKHIFESLKFNGTLKKSPRILTAYNGNALPSLGVCCLPCEHGSVNSKLEFYCLDTNSPPILGMQSCLDYELIKLVYSTETTCTSDSDPMTKSSVLKDYSDIFKGVGLVSGKATIHIDSEVPPVVHPPRRVPVALRGRLNLPISDRKIEEIEKATLSDPQFDILKSVILEEVHKLHGTTSTTVINKLKGTFSRLGIPETVVSDNGPQYSSQEFSEFANKWDFKHVTSSPHYPQSNGLAEKTVQTVKNMFNKCKKDGKDPYVALLEYRTTPLDIGYTPSQLLMCRKLRSVLPTTLEELVPKTPIYNEVQNKIDCKKSYKKKYYDKGSKPLKSLNSGDSVRIRGSNGLWKPAIISSQHPASRSYIVESQDGGIYRRNRRHIIGTREEVPLTTVENDTIVPPVRYEPQCNLTPPELAEPTSNINNSPQITSDTETTETQQIPSDGLYITRSGRIGILGTVSSWESGFWILHNNLLFPAIKHGVLAEPGSKAWYATTVGDSSADLFYICLTAGN
ncbi:unnamed protein product [Mytilus edulis]|uniref:Integrase catalytic domain-containing protein n=1 Tax=Mytilus edulis TaxID=6550 RepID=A0A8S3SJW7_MYTED|nr:unnamed protein product [Mytilus edulis]